MSEFYSVIAGAGIALIGTVITNYFTFKSTQLREEKNDERFIAELDKRIELEIKNFEHNVNMNNRNFIPEANKSIMNTLNQLFDCTEKLVSNYPGTPHTGTHPGLLFNSRVDDINGGFSDSIEEVSELSRSWEQAYKNFSNIVVENSIYLSNSILNDTAEVKTKCKVIRDYFYGFYLIIEDEQQFKFKKEEYINLVKNRAFIDKEKNFYLTYSVLDSYDELKKLKDSLSNSITNYQKQKIDF